MFALCCEWSETVCSKSLNFKEGSGLDQNPYAAGLVFATSSFCAKLFCLLQQPCCDHQGRAERSDPPMGAASGLWTQDCALQHSALRALLAHTCKGQPDSPIPLLTVGQRDPTASKSPCPILSSASTSSGRMCLGTRSCSGHVVSLRKQGCYLCLSYCDYSLINSSCTCAAIVPLSEGSLFAGA